MELYVMNLRRIKCTVLTLFVCIQIGTAAYSQRVTLNVRSIPLETVLDRIQSQTGYLVLYNDELIKNVGKIHVNFRNLELEEAMQTVLNGLPLTYAIQGETILIKPSPIKKEDIREKPAAQETVSGKVVSNTGEPLSGVSVSTTDRRHSAQTNDQGVFELSEVPRNVTLRFSILGYESAEYPVDKLPSSIVLHASLSSLDEVVVTGYGVQQRRSITGSVASVKGDDIEKKHARTII